MPECFWVIVKCLTFNHHAYIEDAMNGFCMQKTDFPYLCVILDDCSTDGEQEVIKNYIAKHFNSITDEETADYVFNLCQHKTNENCYFAVFYLKYNHWTAKKDKNSYFAKWQNKCKYIALCEGDDYWIVPTKLQLQADFLGKNKDYVLCGSNGIICYERLAEAPKYFNTIIDSRELQPNEVINQWIFPTASLFWRNDIDIIRDPKFVVGDIVVALSALKSGKIYCFSNLMVVYRKIYGGSIISNYFSKERILQMEGYIYIYETFKQLTPQYEYEFLDIISQRKKQLSFAKLRNKSLILCVFRFPKLTIKKVINKIFYKLRYTDH